MKHPFHTLFPSAFSNIEPRVVNRDVIVTAPIEILGEPTPQKKPIEKEIPKETPKPILVSESIVLKPVTEDTVVKEVKTIDSSKTL